MWISFFFCWFGILDLYFSYVSYGLNDLEFIIAMFIPALSCFLGYIILVLIKILRCLCCFSLLNKPVIFYLQSKIYLESL